jgi:hypothetical protein
MTPAAEQAWFVREITLIWDRWFHLNAKTPLPNGRSYRIWAATHCLRGRNLLVFVVLSKEIPLGAATDNYLGRVYSSILLSLQRARS